MLILLSLTQFYSKNYLLSFLILVDTPFSINFLYKYISIFHKLIKSHSLPYVFVPPSSPSQISINFLILSLQKVRKIQTVNISKIIRMKEYTRKTFSKVSNILIKFFYALHHSVSINYRPKINTILIIRTCFLLTHTFLYSINK